MNTQIVYENALRIKREKGLQVMSLDPGNMVTRRQARTNCFHQFMHQFVPAAIFRPDGQAILTASSDGTGQLLPDYTIEYIGQETHWRNKRGFTENECQKYFCDDPLPAPHERRTGRTIGPLPDKPRSRTRGSLATCMFQAGYQRPKTSLPTMLGMMER